MKISCTFICNLYDLDDKNIFFWFFPPVIAQFHIAKTSFTTLNQNLNTFNFNSNKAA